MEDLEKKLELTEEILEELGKVMKLLILTDRGDKSSNS